MMKNSNFNHMIIIHHDEEGKEQDQHRRHDQFYVLKYQNYTFVSAIKFPTPI